MLASYKKLLLGYSKFSDSLLEQDLEKYEKLATYGQSPQTVVIACCDSRLEPFKLTQSNLGDLFIIRNVANLVPKYQPMSDQEECHGTMAALEYAVNNLLVQNIIILGHSNCGGIAYALSNDKKKPHNKQSFIDDWMNIVDPVLSDMAEIEFSSQAAKAMRCEQMSIANSMKNCMTFPWVKSKVAAKTLEVHGWYFDIKAAKLSCCHHGSKEFVIV